MTDPVFHDSAQDPAMAHDPQAAASAAPAGNDVAQAEIANDNGAATDPRFLVERVPSAQAPGRPRPQHVPEKFWDARRGEVRIEALLKSYAELERKFQTMLPRPAGEDDLVAKRRLAHAIGMPAEPAGYAPCLQAIGVEPDDEVNERLFEEFFTCDQAALVYRLAGEKLEPMLAELETERETAQLSEHFGGKRQWGDAKRQLKMWAEANLDPEVREALSRSAAGVLAIQQMMRASEPNLIAEGVGAGETDAKQDLHKMMRDPRYWRDKDPSFVAQVTKGFERLYGR